MSHLRTLWRSVFLFCAVAALVPQATASKRLGAERDLSRLTSEADSVIIGQCVAKKVNVVANSFETDYEIEVKEELKGKRHVPGSRVLMTVAGGRLTSPPITQMVQMQPHMFKGENVVLFLDEKPLQLSPEAAKRISPRSKLTKTVRVVGMNEGKLSIVQDEASGKQMVTRLNMENLGYVPDDAVMERVLQAVSKGEVKVKRGPAVAPTQSAPAGKAAKGPLQAGLPPAQDLDEFRAQVRGAAN